MQWIDVIEEHCEKPNLSITYPNISYFKPTGYLNSLDDPSVWCDYIQIRKIISGILITFDYPHTHKNTVFLNLPYTS